METIQRFFSGEIVIDRNSWHYGLYHWWEQKTGGNLSSYQENLCHYMRVVLFWAPLRWFVSQVNVGPRIPEWFIPLSLVLFLAGCIALTIYTIWNIPGLLMFVLLGALVFGTAWLFITLSRAGWRVARKTTPVQKGSSTLKIIVHAALAKKRKICPFIRFRNDDDQ